MAKHLANTLTHLVRKGKYHIQNSEHLVKLLSGIKLEDDDMFVSYDVTALFMSVLCNEVVGIVVKRARNDLTWSDRTKLMSGEMGILLSS